MLFEEEELPRVDRPMSNAGRFECIGDVSGGGLGRRCAVLNLAGVTTYSVLVVFETVELKLGDGIDVPYDSDYDDPEWTIRHATCRP